MAWSCSGELHLGREAERGGLGSSHTAPRGAAVPARPPTRSSETKDPLLGPQWVRRATGQGTAVVVQNAQFQRKLIDLPFSKCCNINRMQGCQKESLWWSPRIVLPETSLIAR